MSAHISIVKNSLAKLTVSQMTASGNYRNLKRHEIRWFSSTLNLQSSLVILIKTMGLFF